MFEEKAFQKWFWILIHIFGTGDKMLKKHFFTFLLVFMDLFQMHSQTFSF